MERRGAAPLAAATGPRRPEVVGTHDLSTRTAGFAAGIDYGSLPTRVVGLAVAGGGTDWACRRGLAVARATPFRRRLWRDPLGSGLLVASFAFTNHWMSTIRFAVGDHLGQFQRAELRGAGRGRLSRGDAGMAAWTPYAAIQAQSLRTPVMKATSTQRRLALAFMGARRPIRGANLARDLTDKFCALCATPCSRCAGGSPGRTTGSAIRADTGVPVASGRELHRDRRAAGAGLDVWCRPALSLLSPAVLRSRASSTASSARARKVIRAALCPILAPARLAENPAREPSIISASP